MSANLDAPDLHNVDKSIATAVDLAAKPGSLQRLVLNAIRASGQRGTHSTGNKSIVGGVA